MKATNEYIDAIATLTKIVEVRRLRSLEDISYLASIPLVQEINSQAKNQIGVDVFSLSNNQEIEKYVEYLNNSVRATIGSDDSNDSLNDEIALLESAKNINNDVFKHYEIKYPKDEAIEYIVDSIKMNKPSLNYLIRNAEYVQAAVLDFTLYFAAVRAKVRSKNAVLLFVLQKEPHELVTITVGSIYVFKEDTPRISSPVRLFLQALHKYGFPITLGIKTQRFFYEGFMTSYDNDMIIREFKRRPDLKMLAFRGAIQHKALGVRYEFAYGEATFKMGNDFAKLQFI